MNSQDMELDVLPHSRLPQKFVHVLHTAWRFTPYAPHVLVAPVIRVERVHLLPLRPLLAHEVCIERRIPYPPLRARES